MSALLKMSVDRVFQDEELLEDFFKPFNVASDFKGSRQDFLIDWATTTPSENHLGLLNFDQVRPEKEYVVRINPNHSQQGHFISLKKWQGIITKISSDKVTATLKDLNDSSANEDEAEIPLEEISQSDLDLVDLGAVFYWNVGYFDSISGQRRRGSEIRFRRLPMWSEEEVEASKAKAKHLKEALGWS
jgi:hypothetical protein